MHTFDVRVTLPNRIEVTIIKEDGNYTYIKGPIQDVILRREDLLALADALKGAAQMLHE